jgi:DNA-binding LytR/AlgR family response regulator
MMKPFFVRTEVRNEKILKRVDPMEVARLSAIKNYTKITLIDDRSYLVRTSLASALKKFPPDMFVKINRAEVVSIFFIDEIAKEYLMMKDKTVPIARPYYKHVVAGIDIIE